MPDTPDNRCSICGGQLLTFSSHLTWHDCEIVKLLDQLPKSEIENLSPAQKEMVRKHNQAESERRQAIFEQATNPKLPIIIYLTQPEIAALEELSKKKDLSTSGVIRQALRLYQLIDANDGKLPELPSKGCGWAGMD